MNSKQTSIIIISILCLIKYFFAAFVPSVSITRRKSRQAFSNLIPEFSYLSSQNCLQRNFIVSLLKKEEPMQTPPVVINRSFLVRQYTDKPNDDQQYSDCCHRLLILLSHHITTPASLASAYDLSHLLQSQAATPVIPTPTANAANSNFANVLPLINNIVPILSPCPFTKWFYANISPAKFAHA